MKHKHCDLIKAWADGAEIQYRPGGPHGNWLDDQHPTWVGCIGYRIKPKTIKYRCYLNTCDEVKVIRCGEDPLVWFVKWLGDWQEVEV